MLSFCLYFFSVDTHARSLGRDNLVFDADIFPVANVIAAVHLRNVERHPLYGLFLGVPGGVAQSYIDDEMLTGTWFSAVMGAIASLIAFWFLERLLESRTDAAWFCVLAGCSASVWLLAAVPETHIFNYASVVLAFALLGRLGRKRRVDRLVRHVVLSILAGVYLMGITVTNIVYVAAGLGLGLLARPRSWLRRITMFTAFVVGVICLFATFSALHRQVAPDETNLLNEPLAPFSTRFLEWDRVPQASELASQARIFLLSTVIASSPSVELVPTISGTQQIIQFEAVSWPELLILAYLAVVTIVLMSRRSAGRFGLTGLLAGSIIVFNLGLHFFFRGNGQPLIFAIHTVFPLVVLLALLYRSSAAPHKRLLVGGLVCTIVVNNALFIFSMNELVARRCVVRFEGTKICAEWDPTVSP